jgi:hypothetical protein
VGPVEVASVNTTVSPTPIPSSELVPPPPLYYAPFPTGAQNPAFTTNSSWHFPTDFWWGVSSAAYQVEGAVKDEGRGPSIWDVLLHRAVGYSVANQTGDIADNHYYLYKQGMFAESPILMVVGKIHCEYYYYNLIKPTKTVSLKSRTPRINL